MNFNYQVVARRKDPRGKGMMTMPVVDVYGKPLTWSWDGAVAEVERRNRHESEGGTIHYYVVKVTDEPE